MTKEMKFKNDIYKEAFMIISNFDENLLEKIPDEFLKKLSDLSAESEMEFTIEEGKSLIEQRMSKECKELISLIYYKFIQNKE